MHLIIQLIPTLFLTLVANPIPGNPNSQINPEKLSQWFTKAKKTKLVRDYYKESEIEARKEAAAYKLARLQQSIYGKNFNLEEGQTDHEDDVAAKEAAAAAKAEIAALRKQDWCNKVLEKYNNATGNNFTMEQAKASGKVSGVAQC